MHGKVTLWLQSTGGKLQSMHKRSGLHSWCGVPVHARIKTNATQWWLLAAATCLCRLCVHCHFVTYRMCAASPLLAGVRGLQLAPDALQDTPQLEVLLASTAALQQFPAAVLACTGLRQLGLSSNSISSLPAEVTQLTR